MPKLSALPTLCNYSNVMYIYVTCHDVNMIVIESSQRTCIFTVCNEVAEVIFLHLSVCPQGGGLPQCMLGYPPDQTSRGKQTPQQTATAADGTHPTGMYSCYVKETRFILLPQCGLLQH